MNYLEQFYKSTTRQNAVNSVTELIQPKFYKMSLEQCNSIQEQLPELLQTSWNKLLSDVSTNRSILEMIIKAMFTSEIDIKHYDLVGINLSKVSPTQVSMIFGAFPNKSEHNKFGKMVQECLGDDFIVKVINGDNTSNREAEEEVKGMVNKSKRLGKRVILISKDMASRSFSIPEIDLVLLMYDNGSLAQTIQKVSRVFTPGETYGNETKTVGVVVNLSLDSNRNELDPIDQYVVAEAERIHDENESFQDSIKRVAHSFNIFINDLRGGTIKLNPDEYADELISSSSLIKVLSGTIDYSNIDLTQYNTSVLSIMSNDSSYNPDKVEVNINNVQKYVDENESVGGEGREPSEDDLKQIKENIEFFVNNITTLSILDVGDNNDIENILNSIKNKKLQYEVEEYFGLSFDFICILISKNVISKRLTNTILKAFSNKDEVFEWI
jgi:hypothetical protein